MKTKKQMNKVTTNTITDPLKNIKWLDDKSRVSLKYLAGINRSIYPAQVTKLAMSLNKMGTIRPIVVAVISFITGKAEKYIIDGQHIYNALIRNGMPIPYIEIGITDKKDLVEKIALLNASSKTWCQLDYVTAWGSLIPDYVRLNHYYQVYDMDFGTLSSVLSGGSGIDSGHTSLRIKKGEFKIKDEDKNVKLLDYLTDILNIIPRMDRKQNRYLCSEYLKFVRGSNNYDHPKFVDVLKRHKKEFILATQEEGKLAELFSNLK